jgi:RNA recognition motif-containing protein
MSRKIFVGGLNWSTSEATLQNIFQRFGIIQNIKLVTDQATGRSKGYAFITYDNEMAAQVSMSQMDGRQIEGRTIKVNFAFERCEGMEDDEDFEPPLKSQFPIPNYQKQQQTSYFKPEPSRWRERESSFPAPERQAPVPSEVKERIYVGGLDWRTDEGAIHDAFSPFGTVEDVRIVFDKQTNQSKGFCFVTFATEAEAEEAIQGMNGTLLDGRTLRVNRAQFRAAPVGAPQGNGKIHHHQRAFPSPTQPFRAYNGNRR